MRSFAWLLIGLGAVGCNGGDIGGDALGDHGAGGATFGGSTTKGSANGDVTTASTGAGASDGGGWADVDESDDDTTLAIPEVGSFSMRLVSPTVIEITAIVTKAADPAPVSAWDFPTTGMPANDALAVTVAGTNVAVSQVGFKRRVLSAPLRPVDLRIQSSLELVLASPIDDGAHVVVVNGSAALLPSGTTLAKDAYPHRHGAAIHVDDSGYGPSLPKHARVGYYLGSLGEMPAPAATTFQLVATKDGSVAFEGPLAPHPESPDGWTLAPYENLLDADFSSFTTPGNYRLVVPGLGASHAFWIDDGTPAVFARAYALGLYHQRCGAESALPFTRFTRGACHTDMAEIPTTDPAFDDANAIINSNSGIGGVGASLYPIVKTGSIDVTGGHHDAGDYSKYTINSAHLIHTLVFAADSITGAGDLDNLGIPESGDGKSDLLEEAKWEADFLAKMQDDDGGFFTLVYPRHRAYEDDVTPDHGDAQIVWPKTTSVTAAASAALAQIASSPRFRAQFSTTVADAYLAKAKNGFAFVEAAIAAHGFDGAYQMFYQYGDQFHHNDEIAWAATELYLATGDSHYADTLQSVFPDPSDPATFVWSWVRMSESYGNAIRSYAFGARSGRIDASKLDAAYLAKCEEQIGLAGADQRRWASEDAYGTSFPTPSKQYQTAGWYFSSNQAFDAAVAYQLDPKPELLATIVSNLDYEGGENPADVTFVSGLGWRRARSIVSQQALNDREVLPPTGIISGNVEASFAWLDGYGTSLNALSAPDTTCPFYERWGDSWNVMTESVSVNEARALATAALLMARSSTKSQAWKSANAKISGASGLSAGTAATLTLDVDGLSLAGARVVWEASDLDPTFGSTLAYTPKSAHGFVEVEAQWPDGRRAFANASY